MTDFLKTSLSRRAVLQTAAVGAIGINPALRAAVAAAGYHLGFAGRGAINRLGGGFDPLDVRRSTVERGLSRSYFFGMLAIPAIEHPPPEGSAGVPNSVT